MNQPTPLFFLFVFLVASYILNLSTNASVTILHVFILGPMSWTFQEYLAHRFLLHHGSLFQKAHHGHHIHPSAFEKLFIPIEITAIFALVNFLFFCRLFGLAGALNNLASSIFCYLAFEWTHWQAHRFGKLGETKSPYGFCEFHIMHHKCSKSNFGFTCATWDILFDTCDPNFKRKTFMLLIPFPILPLIINHYIS